MTVALKPLIDLGSNDWRDAAHAAELEWLSTNGIGGYAFGTASGALAGNKVGAGRRDSSTRAISAVSQ